MHSKKKNDQLSRREFGRAALAAAAAVGAGLGSPLLSRAAAGAEEERAVTEIPANAGIIQAIGYVPQSQKENQRCANCVLYSGPAEGAGKCSVFQQGRVSAQAWCNSWAARPQ